MTTEAKSRITESEVPTTCGVFRVWWVDSDEGKPVRLLVPLKNANGSHDRDLTPEEAYALGDALTCHAVDSGYDPDTGETLPTKFGDYSGKASEARAV